MSDADNLNSVHRPFIQLASGTVRFRLLPSDDKFFDLFNAAATNVAECSRRLRELLEQPGPGGSATIDAVIACEKRGDDLTSDVLRRLNTSFVTPFDREDIHALA